MRVLVQRVSQARVLVDDQVVGRIDRGLLLLVAAHPDDDDKALEFCADKCTHLRIFPDVDGKMNRSVLDVDGQILVVSQFTLYGDCRKGRRPSYGAAAQPQQAEPLYERFLQILRQRASTVAAGVFGAHMMVELTNDGPVTLMIDSP